MTWALSILLGGWKSLLRASAGIFGWLFAEWHRPVIASLSIALGWLMLFTLPGLRADLASSRAETVAANAAHEQTIANYREASAAAMAAAERRKAATEAQWRAELEEARRENLALRADYRSRVARFVRGQQGTATTDPGSADATGLPGAAAVPAGLVPPPGYAVVPVRDLELAADAYAQLTALIAWAEAVGAPE